jgi:predicted MPP superfamily phosphohydrolase
MGTKNGEKYVEGFFPDASTPLYVTRGVGTTGPPARMGALAEVSILTLHPA